MQSLKFTFLFSRASPEGGELAPLEAERRLLLQKEGYSALYPQAEDKQSEPLMVSHGWGQGTGLWEPQNQWLRDHQICHGT